MRSEGGRLQLRGDESRLFAAHHRKLVQAVARSTGVRPCLVEEACSFAWLQFCLSQPDREKAYPWLALVARREAVRLARAEQRAAPLDPSPCDGDGRPAPSLVESVPDPGDPELRTRARGALVALARLPERQRRPMALKVAGHSYQEIGRELGWSYTQVNRHLTRARKRLVEAAAAA